MSLTCLMLFVLTRDKIVLKSMLLWKSASELSERLSPKLVVLSLTQIKLFFYPCYRLLIAYVCLYCKDCTVHNIEPMNSVSQLKNM